MEFPTHDADETLEQVYRNFMSDARRARSKAKGMSDDIEAGVAQQTRILVMLFEDLWSIRSRWPGYRDTPGIGPYAKSRWDGDPAINVVDVFNAVNAAMVSFLQWFDANIPKASDGSIKERKIEPDGSLSWNTISAANLAPLKVELDALIVTIAL